MKDYRLGFIGCGHMGMAMARGACRILNKEDIAVYDPSDKVMMICETEGFRVLNRSETPRMATAVRGVQKYLRIYGCTISRQCDIMTICVH